MKILVTLTLAECTLEELGKLNELLAALEDVDGITTEVDQESEVEAEDYDDIEEEEEEDVEEEEEEEEEEDDEEAQFDFNDIKKAANAAKKAHGVEFLKAVLELFEEVNVTKTVNQQMAQLELDSYPDFISTLEEGPGEDEEEDEELGVDADTVKDLIRQYAKQAGQPEARKLMKKHGAKGLNAVADLDEDSLSGLFDDLNEVIEE